METLGSFLDSLAARDPNAEVLSYAPHREVTARLTWRELGEQSRRAAKRLVELGLGKGSRLGFLCSNRIEWLPIAFGALRLGAVLVPFSTLWKREEIAYGLRHGDVDTLLLRPAFLKHDYLGSLQEIVPEILDLEPGRPLYSLGAPALRRVLLLDAAGDPAVTRPPAVRLWSSVEGNVSDPLLDALEAAVVPSDWATIFFTSGTTAQAKAVLHCHGALTTSARRLAPCFGIEAGDVWWGHMPLFWSGGFVLGALATMAGGGRLVLHERVDADAAFDILERERCTIMAGWHQAGPLLEHPDFGKRRLSLCKGTHHVLATRLLGPNNHTIGVYGMSETATAVTAAAWNDPEESRTGSFGKPLQGMLVRIVDPETRQPLGTGQTGEIHVKGPTLMEGYYKVPRATTFDAEGYFKTGDLGFFDEHGNLHFATRLKDVIKTAGVNVAAVEVEEALCRHDAVKSAHVVGVSHPTRGQNIAAFIVPRPGALATEEELRDFCRQTLAAYKVPKHIFFLEENALPRTGTGKIEKPRLAEEAERRLAGKDPA